jgi:mRNA interferase RelE/StbE
VRYEIDFLPEARHDLKRLSPEIARRIMRKIIAMQGDLAGNIKRLVHYTPGLRLRVGEWRVLFEVAGSMIIIHRIVHRSEAYE